MRTALYPGSFDPFTIGHLAILRKAVELFDRVVVAVGVNSDKRYAFSKAERLDKVRAACKDFNNVEVVEYSCLTTNLCKQHGARYIVRGLRSAADFEYESEIAEINRLLDPEIETVFLLSEPQYRMVSSSMVRELMAYGEDTSKWTC